MFRIEAFCDDKRLSEVLHALAGKVLGQPNIQPVANGKVQGGKAVAASSDEVCDLFAAHAKKHKLTKFKASDMRAFCTANGLASTSANYVLKKLFECKAIRKHGKGSAMYYTVIK